MTGPVRLTVLDDGGFPVVLEAPEPANAMRWHVRWGIDGQHSRSFQSMMAAAAFARRTFQPAPGAGS